MKHSEVAIVRLGIFSLVLHMQNFTVKEFCIHLYNFVTFIIKNLNALNVKESIMDNILLYLR